jgi:outer membrane protein assembly factor BamB
MTRTTFVLATCVVAVLNVRIPAAGPVEIVAPDGEGAKYWSRWRGPSGQGHVTGTNYVDTWSDKENIKWRAAVPGIGHSSPIVWKDHIFLTTSRNDGSRLSMLAYSRSTGKQLWETEIRSTGIEHLYPKNSHASATATTDGERVYASFGTHGLAAFDFNGALLWQSKIGDLSNYHGSAGSPVLYKDRIFLYQDHDGTASTGSFVAAFDKLTGKTLWKTARGESVGWGTPIVIRTETRDELIVSSQRRVAGYDPQSGRELWTVRGLTFEVIPTPVVGHGLVFCSSGRQGPTIAIRPGGAGDVTSTHVAWSALRGSPFVPSGLVHGDLLYLINDMQSVLTAYDAKAGTVVYQGRLGIPVSEGFSSSPVAVGDQLFFTNDQGETFVVAAGREFKLLRTNTLNAQVLASPALVDGVWYWRTSTELIAISK